MQLQDRQRPRVAEVRRRAKRMRAASRTPRRRRQGRRDAVAACRRRRRRAKPPSRRRPAAADFPMTSRPTVLASTVLALALLGDLLLYAVLPLHAPSFGVSMAWVGVLLSANRVIRLFVYPFLPRIAATGLRRFTITGAALGAVSTLAF